MSVRATSPSPEPSSGNVTPLRRPRYAALPLRALRDPGMKLERILVLGAIAAHADPAGIAWPSLKGIARACRVPRCNVPRALAWLESAGYLVREQRGGGKDNRSNRYRLIWGEPGAATEPHGGFSHEATLDQQGGCAHETTLGAEGGFSGDAGVVAPEKPQVVARETLGVVAPEKPEQPIEQPKGTTQETFALADTIAVEFDRWWELVPKKVDKAEALKLFRRIRKKIPLETLRAGMQRHRDQFQPYGLDDVRFATGPAKWLRGERWDDETLPAGATANGTAPTHAANGGGLFGAMRRVHERSNGGNHG